MMDSVPKGAVSNFGPQDLPPPTSQIVEMPVAMFQSVLAGILAWLAPPRPAPSEFQFAWSVGASLEGLRASPSPYLFYVSPYPYPLL
jgi:hypothetical protein